MTNPYQIDITGLTYHPENSVIALICKTLQAMLNAAGYTDWVVLRSNQPTLQEIQNNCIYIDVISKRRLGVQGDKLANNSNQWSQASVWYEEWDIQISGFKQRNPETDSIDTITSTDVITILQGMINGGGIQPIGASTWWPYPWLNIIRSTTVNIFDYETDSGLREKLPTFDFTMVIEQAIKSEVGNISEIEGDLHRV